MRRILRGAKYVSGRFNTSQVLGQMELSRSDGSDLAAQVLMFNGFMNVVNNGDGTLTITINDEEA